jgi:TIR domain
MHHVFVSYSRREKQWVSDLVETLRKLGVPVWIDTAEIRISAPWFEEISDAITEADLFLICDSDSWRQSLPCNAEADRAAVAGKPTIRLPAGTDIDEAARIILTEYRRVSAEQRLRTELTTLARDWDRTGRPRAALVSRRQAKRLRRSATATVPIERTFLRASIARARRRTLVAAVITVTVAGSLLAVAVTKAAKNLIDKANAEQAAVFTRNRELRLGQANDPIIALSTATALGGNESFTNADYISDAFRQPEPDDAFKVPAAARRFASQPIRSQVTVLAAAGRAWRRAADASSVRVATMLPRRLHLAPVALPGSLRVRTSATSGAIEVFRNSLLWRRIYLKRPSAASVLSPNGRLLAVAEGNAVDLVDIALGQTRTVLRSSATVIRDVAWSADGNDVWALGPGVVLMWDVRQGVLVDKPDTHFEGVLPAASSGQIWAVSQDGRLSELSVATGTRSRVLRVPDTVTSAAGSPDGSVAALSGEHGLWIIRLSGKGSGATRHEALPNCSLGRAAFKDGSLFALPCLGGPILIVSTRTGKVTGRVSVSPSGAFAVKFLPRSGTLLASDQYATLYSIDGQRHVRTLFVARCGGSISRIAVAPEDSVIIPVGAGTGRVACSSRLQRTGGDAASPGAWRGDSVVDDATSAVAQAAAVSRGGNVFAYGYDDGTVILHPTQNITPTQTVSSVIGAIRDMLVTANDELIVATDAGVVQRISLCERCLSNHALAAAARKVIEHEVAIGVAKRVRPRPAAGT